MYCKMYSHKIFGKEKFASPFSIHTCTVDYMTHMDVVVAAIKKFCNIAHVPVKHTQKKC